MECPCGERQGPKTLPDFISRSAEHSFWDGDIYMALYTTASCCRPKALAKSGTRANEWGGNVSERTRRRWLMCCAEEAQSTWVYGVYVKFVNYAVIIYHLCPCISAKMLHDVASVLTFVNDYGCFVQHICKAMIPHKHIKSVNLSKTHYTNK